MMYLIKETETIVIKMALTSFG